MSKEEDVSAALAPAPEVSKVVLSCLVVGLFIAVIAGVVYFGDDESKQVSTASEATVTAANQSNVPGSIKETDTTARSVEPISTVAARTTVAEKQSTTTVNATTTVKVTTTVATTEATISPTTVKPAPVSQKPATDSEPSADDWSKLRDCEASGNYQISSRNGLYHGAYQFDQSTWDGTAKNAGRTDLVGILPAKVDPADQDAMALELYRSRGDKPWPTCGRYLK